MNKTMLFFYKLLWFIPLIIAVGMTNYYVDPAQLFTDRAFEKKLVQQFLNFPDRGVELDRSMENFDYRFLQQEYVKDLKVRKEVLVLGSSSVMAVTSDLFPGKSFFNAWVAWASLNDLIAIYGLYRQKGFLPETVVLGVDPWILDRADARAKRAKESLRDSYERVMKDMGGSNFFWSLNIEDHVPVSVSTLFSFSYFQVCLEYLFSHSQTVVASKDGKGYTVVSQRYNENLTRWSDGSMTPAKRLRELAPAKVEADILADEKTQRRGGPDKELIERFDDFLALLRKDGVKVIIYLPPHHPVQYQLLEQGTDGVSGTGKHILKRTESVFRDLAAKNGAVVIGSYDAQEFHIQGARFFDAIHLRFKEDVAPIFQKAGFAIRPAGHF